MAEEIRKIQNRIEMFVDKWLIDSQRNTYLKLNTPQKQEVALVMDMPWEGNAAGCYTVFEDNGKILLCYRGNCNGDYEDEQVTCIAESYDGIHFNRPVLGLYEFKGSKENNIIWKGIESHNFFPFKDLNPKVLPDQRFKAIGGVCERGKDFELNQGTLYGFCSSDGIHWNRIQETPITTNGQFDTQNVVFWDSLAGKYRLYTRYWDGDAAFKGIRGIQSAVSDDFLNWKEPARNKYQPDIPKEHLYTNATIQCPGAEHIYLSFPKRFEPERKRVDEHAFIGLSEAVFMTSRDGISWDRTFMEAWSRPGLDRQNWTDRSSMMARGIIVEKESFVMYISEHYRWKDNRLRRMTIRKNGFASIHADYETGTMDTKLILLEGTKLLLNYSTSIAGHIRIGIKDIEGRDIPGFTMEDMNLLYGDSLKEAVRWKGDFLPDTMKGKPVRMTFELMDADVYALQIEN